MVENIFIHCKILCKNHFVNENISLAGCCHLVVLFATLMTPTIKYVSSREEGKRGIKKKISGDYTSSPFTIRNTVPTL